VCCLVGIAKMSTRVMVVALVQRVGHSASLALVLRIAAVRICIVFLADEGSCNVPKKSAESRAAPCSSGRVCIAVFDCAARVPMSMSVLDAVSVGEIDLDRAAC